MTKLEYKTASHAPHFVRENELHVWRLDLGAGGKALTQTDSLSFDELSRDRAYRRPADARCYVTARIGLRKILGTYLNVGERDVRFVHNEHGKPELNRRFHPGALHFNMSRSRQVAVVAVSKDSAVGVDVEFIDPNFPFMNVAEKYFPPSTVKRLRQLPSDQAQSMFFDLWTAIEAYGKGKGAGLSDSVRINCSGDASSEKLLPSDDWSVVNIFAGDNYSAAVATKTSVSCFRYWQASLGPRPVEKVRAAAMSAGAWQS